MMVRVPSNGEITPPAKKGSLRLLRLLATGTAPLAKWAVATQISVFSGKCLFGLEPRAFTISGRSGNASRLTDRHYGSFVSIRR
jgi:hypothetical protein